MQVCYFVFQRRIDSTPYQLVLYLQIVNNYIYLHISFKVYRLSILYYYIIYNI